MRESDAHRWTRPATILVATDLSDLEHLMPFALEQASDSNAQLILLHVLPATAAVTADAAGMPYYDSEKALLEIGRANDAGHGAISPAAGTFVVMRWRAQVTPHIRLQPASVSSTQIAMLLGTRSRSKIGKLLIGSVAENKGCARLTSRSSPWVPRLISRWLRMRNSSSFTPPLCERPLARAQRLPARLRQPKG